MTEGGHGRQIKMCDIIPTNNSITPLMGYLAFVPLYKDTRRLAGADDTSIQLDRNELLECGYLRNKHHLVAWGEAML